MWDSASRFASTTVRRERACSTAASSVRCCLSRIGQFRVLGGELRVQLVETRYVRLDGVDLLRALPAKITVVDEHAPGAGGILLIQEQLQRLLVTYQISGPELSREGGAALGDARLRVTLLRGQRGPARRPLGSLVAHAVEGFPRLADRDFC